MPRCHQPCVFPGPPCPAPRKPWTLLEVEGRNIHSCQLSQCPCSKSPLFHSTVFRRRSSWRSSIPWKQARIAQLYLLGPAPAPHFLPLAVYCKPCLWLWSYPDGRRRRLRGHGCFIYPPLQRLRCDRPLERHQRPMIAKVFYRPRTFPDIYSIVPLARAELATPRIDVAC